jgi:hypothetical protein
MPAAKEAGRKPLLPAFFRNLGPDNRGNYVATINCFCCLLFATIELIITLKIYLENQQNAKIQAILRLFN